MSADYPERGSESRAGVRQGFSQVCVRVFEWGGFGCWWTKDNSARVVRHSASDGGADVVDGSAENTLFACVSVGGVRAEKVFLARHQQGTPQPNRTKSVYVY